MSEVIALMSEATGAMSEDTALERLANECRGFDKTVGAGLVPARRFGSPTGRHKTCPYSYALPVVHAKTALMLSGTAEVFVV
jgi:hypothetical protein